VFTLIRLVPMNDKDKTSESLALRHQLTIPQHQIDQPRLTTTDRGVPRRAPPPASPHPATTATPDRLPGHDPALAS
jgi:hypothetical protein